MRISIVTVSYNSVKTIEQTIISVLSQKNAEFEYIIIDGGSTDGTKEIIEKYKDYIDYYVSEADAGISDAFNKGIKHCTGDVIGLINSDDILLSGALEYVDKAMKKESDVFCCRIEAFKTIDSYPCIFAKVNAKPIDFGKLKTEMVISHPATFVRRNAYQKYGCFDIQYRYSMDRELLLRMYLKGATFQQSNMVLTLFRVDGLTGSQFQKSINESYVISRKYGIGFVNANIVRLKKMIYYYLHKMNEKL